MSLRKIWLLILIGVTATAIILNTLVLTFLTDKYYSDYLIESYNEHVNQILNYTKEALLTTDTSYKQMYIELESHLNDPIIGIKVYDQSNDLIVEVATDYHMDMPMMRSRMFSDELTEEVHSYEISSGGSSLATVHITNHSVAENSFVARRFSNALWMNSFLSLLISVLIALFIGVIVSRKMSRSLIQTANYADELQAGQVSPMSTTHIMEVNRIRESLKQLSQRLKLKRQTRKGLLDQLVHQTRTPLAIMKSHLEAIEDDLVEVNQNEIDIFNQQIDQLTLLISNMSAMIDADSSEEKVQIETFDISEVMYQIINGLKTQFKKKDLKINFENQKSIVCSSDLNKIRQSIYNILINAYKYTPEKGQISCSLEGDESIRIIIEDTGIGMSPKEMDEIFHAYYQGSHHEEGDGLGLYIALNNMKQIQGTIEVDSILKQGSKFTLIFPKNYKSM